MGNGLWELGGNEKGGLEGLGGLEAIRALGLFKMRRIVGKWEISGKMG
jgi:hypothetical protein